MSFCSKCGKQAEKVWNYCPMDATPFTKYNNDGTAKVYNPYMNNNGNYNNNNNIQNPYLHSSNNQAYPQITKTLITKTCGRCAGKGSLGFNKCKVCNNSFLS